MQSFPQIVDALFKLDKVINALTSVDVAQSNRLRALDLRIEKLELEIKELKEKLGDRDEEES